MKKVLEYSTKEELLNEFVNHFEALRDENGALIVLAQDVTFDNKDIATVESHGRLRGSNLNLLHTLVSCCEKSEEFLGYLRTVVAFFDAKKGE